MAYVLEAGDQPARNLEIISPAGFEGFFAALIALGGVIRPSRSGYMNSASAMVSTWIRSVPGLVERFGLLFPGEAISIGVKSAQAVLRLPGSRSPVQACGHSRRTTLKSELLIFRPPLYSMNPSLRNWFMKKLTRDRVVPIISARVS